MDVWRWRSDVHSLSNILIDAFIFVVSTHIHQLYPFERLNVLLPSSWTMCLMIMISSLMILLLGFTRLPLSLSATWLLCIIFTKKVVIKQTGPSCSCFAYTYRITDNRKTYSTSYTILKITFVPVRWCWFRLKIFDDKMFRILFRLNLNQFTAIASFRM